MAVYTISAYSQRMPVRRDNSTEIIRYDTDNAYPQRVAEIVGMSGTATACIDLLYRFMKGEGFEDATLSTMPINSRMLTPNKLLRLITKDYAMFGGFSVHVNYNALLEIESLNYVPFEHVRFGMPDDQGIISKVALYYDWDRRDHTRIKRKTIDHINLFNPRKDVVAAQIKRAGGLPEYKGQVLYYTGDIQKYPKPVYDPVLEDCETDAEIKMFKFRQLKTGFLGTKIGMLPFAFQSDEERDQFKADLKEFQGSKNAFSLMLLENQGGPMDGNTFPLHDMETKSFDRQFEYTEETVQGNIRRAFNQPPVLRALETAGKLGSSQEMEDAVKFYNRYTRDYRTVISEVFEEIFSNFHKPILGSLDITPFVYLSEDIDNGNDNGANSTE